MERELGRGAMAVVYRAIQINLDRPVALKVLTDELARNGEFVSRFFNEARAAAALSHPNIIQAYDAGVVEETGIHFFAMEYVEGKTLLQRIDEEGSLSVRESISIAQHIADALNYGWQKQQLTHGDIKPENIMQNAEGVAKLADFGLAKVAGHDFEGSGIMLTPLYASPERIRGIQTPGDCRSDIYSFGATLYHMLAGTPPFPGVKAQEVLQRQLEEPLMPLNQRKPGIPRAVSDVVGKLLEKDPDDRPRDWQAVCKQLRKLRQLLARHRGGRSVTSTGARKIVTAATAAAVSRSTRAGAPDKGSPDRKSKALSLPFLLLIIGLLALVGVLVKLVLDNAKGGAPQGDGGGEKAVVGSPLAGPVSPAKGVETAETPVRTVASAWAEMKEKCRNTTNPVECVGLLESFGALYAGELPPDYRDVLAQYREAAKWRLAAERARNGQPRPTGGQTNVPPSSGQTAGRTMDGKRTGGERDGDAEGGAPPGKPEEGEATVRDAAAVKDDFAEYIAGLAAFEYTPGKSAEELMRRGEEWLLNHPVTGDERAVVAFVVTTVLPSIDECLPKLVTLKERLVGLKFPGRRFPRARVTDLTIHEIQLEETTQHGRIARSVRWAELHDPRYLLHFWRKALTETKITIDEARPYLALMLFTNQFKIWDEILSALPPGTEKRQWEVLRVHLATGKAEGAALQLWRSANIAFAARCYSAAHRALHSLQKSRTAVARRHRERIAAMKAEAAPKVPEAHAGELLRQARRRLAVDPRESLALASLVQCRYGNADFPEKNSLLDIRRDALFRLPVRNEGMLSAARRAPESVLRPFLAPLNGNSIPALRWVLEAARSDALTPMRKSLMPALEGAALLELGDWSGARARCETVAPESLDNAPGVFRGPFLFTQALLDWHFSARNPDIAGYVGAFRRMEKRNAGTAQGLHDALLLLEYLLVVGDLERDPAEILRWREVSDAHRSSLTRRYALDALAYLVGGGRTAEAVKRLREVLGDGSGSPGHGFRPGEQAFLQRILEYLNGDGALSAAQLREFGNLDEFSYRLLVSALVQRDARTGEGLEWLYGQATEVGGAFGPVGGSALFDTICLRVSRALAAGDADAAWSAAEWGLRLRHRALFPYFARLCFLQAGVGLLQGMTEAGTEIGVRLGAGTVASSTERALAELLEKDADRGHVRMRVRKRDEAKFWYTWLSATERLGAREAGQGKKAVARFRGLSSAARYAALVEALGGYAGKTRTPPEPR